ncbi:MAG: class I SAM-dependent rRNA methyltransferase [Deinococcales bacterium]
MKSKSTLKNLRLAENLQSALASGHPWIYRNHLPKHNLVMGDWVRLEAGKTAAIGLYDSESAIAVRLLSWENLPDSAWVFKRIEEALALRSKLDQATNAYRLIYGENDFLPAITVDRYDRFAVLKSYSPSVDGLIPDVVKALSKLIKLKGIVKRSDKGLERLYGELPPPEVTIQENGLKLLANLYEGQKTGLFLDHRDNRQTLSSYCEGKTVLNLFSYSGAFSLYALKGGASKVTSVDIAAKANEDAKRNVALNGFEAHRHEAISRDCFELLQDYKTQGKSFDVVILDPPSLAMNKKNRQAAEKAYKKLNSLALACLHEGGLLATASCTSQISPDDFRALLGEAASQSHKRLQMIHEAGHAADHPVRAGFLEGRYLKFILSRVWKAL